MACLALEKSEGENPIYGLYTCIGDVAGFNHIPTSNRGRGPHRLQLGEEAGHAGQGPGAPEAVQVPRVCRRTSRPTLGIQGRGHPNTSSPSGEKIP